MSIPVSLTFSGHALERMFERKITPLEVRKVVQTAKVIDNYPDDKPFPSKLLLGIVNERPIHVVVAYNIMDDMIIVITAYEPTTEKWDPTFERKRS